MQHKIIGDSFPVLQCFLNKNEKMITQRGGNESVAKYLT